MIHIRLLFSYVSKFLIKVSIHRGENLDLENNLLVHRTLNRQRFVGRVY